MNKNQQEYVDFLREYFPELPHAVEGFFNLLEREGIEVLESEETVWNDEYEYAGTLDLVLKFSHTIALGIGDIKTGFVGWESAMQTESYRRAWNTMEVREHYAQERVIFRYRKDLVKPRWDIIVHENKYQNEDWKSFLSALYLFNSRKSYERRGKA